MSAPWTYNTLYAALQSWPVNTNPDYLADLPRLISLGELRTVRDLSLEIFELEDTVDTVAGTDTVARPADLLVPRWLRIAAGTTKYPPLKRRTVAFLEAAFPSSAVADRGRPEMYAEHGESTWLLGPTPDAVYTITYRYVARPTPLSSSNQTSWLGTHVPDLLFAACLMESDHYLKADDRYEDWKKKYVEFLGIASDELKNATAGKYSPYKPAAKEGAPGQ